MSLYLTRFPDSQYKRNWEDLFGRYGRVAGVESVHSYWRINFEDDRDAVDALRDLQGKKIDGVRLVLTNERPDSSKNPIVKDEVPSLRLFINGKVTLTNGSKVNIEPIEINVPIKY